LKEYFGRIKAALINIRLKEIGHLVVYKDAFLPIGIKDIENMA